MEREGAPNTGSSSKASILPVKGSVNEDRYLEPAMWYSEKGVGAGVRP